MTNNNNGVIAYPVESVKPEILPTTPTEAGNFIAAISNGIAAPVTRIVESKLNANLRSQAIDANAKVQALSINRNAEIQKALIKVEESRVQLEGKKVDLEKEKIEYQIAQANLNRVVQEQYGHLDKIRLDMIKEILSNDDYSFEQKSTLIDKISPRTVYGSGGI